MPTAESDIPTSEGPGCTSSFSAAGPSESVSDIPEPSVLPSVSMSVSDSMSVPETLTGTLPATIPEQSATDTDTIAMSEETIYSGTETESVASESNPSLETETQLEPSATGGDLL